MKSRGATYLLLLAVVAVWGVIGWKILAPPTPDTLTAPATKPARQPPPAADTLRLDYPDPFLKNEASHTPTAAVVRSLPRPHSAPKRERIPLMHLGTIVSGGGTMHILTVGGEQYEIRQGGYAGGFCLTRADQDSLYLSKDGLIYGVKLCE